MISMSAILSALQFDPLAGISVIGARELESAYYPPLNPSLGALVLELGSVDSSEKLISVLRAQYPGDHRVSLLEDIDGPATEVSLNEINEPSSAVALFLPPIDDLSSVESLQDTVAHLRAPEGCPWDREQTHQTLRKHLLEEAYETLEAIDREDIGALREELGDLLLQILMHAQIAQESGNFGLPDVVAGIQAKLIRRHPHVFGDLEVSDVDQVLTNWEHFKREENDNGPLDGVPRSLPALAQASELQDRASRVGFKWPSIAEVMDKVKEELAELEGEIEPKAQAEELGDLLFAIVNYARWIKADPEAELQRAALRFRSRFSMLLQTVASTGRSLDELEINELLQFWEEAKEASA